VSNILDDLSPYTFSPTNHYQGISFFSLGSHGFLLYEMVQPWVFLYHPPLPYNLLA